MAHGLGGGCRGLRLFQGPILSLLLRFVGPYRVPRPGPSSARPLPLPRVGLRPSFVFPQSRKNLLEEQFSFQSPRASFPCRCPTSSLTCPETRLLTLILVTSCPRIWTQKGLGLESAGWGLSEPEASSGEGSPPEGWSRPETIQLLGTGTSAPTGLGREHFCPSVTPRAGFPSRSWGWAERAQAQGKASWQHPHLSEDPLREVPAVCLRS